jgi:hypothetical protein
VHSLMWRNGLDVQTLASKLGLPPEDLVRIGADELTALRLYDALRANGCPWHWNDFAEAWGFSYRMDPNGETWPDPSLYSDVRDWCTDIVLYRRMYDWTPPYVPVGSELGFSLPSTEPGVDDRIAHEPTRAQYGESQDPGIANLLPHEVGSGAAETDWPPALFPYTPPSNAERQSVRWFGAHKDRVGINAWFAAVVVDKDYIPMIDHGPISRPSVPGETRRAVEEAALKTY